MAISETSTARVLDCECILEVSRQTKAGKTHEKPRCEECLHECWKTNRLLQQPWSLSVPLSTGIAAFKMTATDPNIPIDIKIGHFGDVLPRQSLLLVDYKRYCNRKPSTGFYVS